MPISSAYPLRYSISDHSDECCAARHPHCAWNWVSQWFGVGVDRVGEDQPVFFAACLKLSSLHQARNVPTSGTACVEFRHCGGRLAGLWGTNHGRQSDGDPTPMWLFFATSSPKWCLDHSQQWLLGTPRAMPSPLVLLLSEFHRTLSRCLIAPTWRGPLPTMMGGKRKLGEWIARVGIPPVLGQLLYRLNVGSLQSCV